jgi:hypothetical protein
VTDEQPSSSAHALVVSGERSLRGVKPSLDELDDEDVAHFVRTLNSVTPRQLLSAVGTVLGVGAGIVGVAASGISPVFGIVGVSLAVGAAGIFVQRRNQRAVFLDEGLAPAVVDQLLALPPQLRRQAIANARVSPWRLKTTAEDYQRIGRAWLAAARAHHKDTYA